MVRLARSVVGLVGWIIKCFVWLGFEEIHAFELEEDDAVGDKLEGQHDNSREQFRDYKFRP